VGMLLLWLHELAWGPADTRLGDRTSSCKKGPARPEDGCDLLDVKRYIGETLRLVFRAERESCLKGFGFCRLHRLVEGCIAAETASRRSLDTLGS
jgi:hypothetical protein